jgi:hypothetical protein
MKIIYRILKNGVFDRILQKDNLEKVFFNNGEIIKYTGYYYKPANETIIVQSNNEIKIADNFTQIADNFTQIETTFIGIIETVRMNDDITTGIYVKPLYIMNIISNEWNVISNYKPPIYNSYFLYPHLLMLPEYNYHYRPLYFLDTCVNVGNDEYDTLLNCSIEFDLQK